MIYNEFPGLLEKAIQNGLPGTEVQWEMASSDRRIKDFPRKKKPGSKLAAVLILLYPYKDSIYTVFMQRPEYKGVHSGQISFPGGKMETGDNNLTETAIREACEETGFCSKNLQILGTLTPLFIPVSDIEVTPVVAYTGTRPDFEPDDSEVVELFEAPLEAFLESSIVKEKTMQIREDFLLVKFYDFNNRIIWGATAMILHELLEIIRRIG